jgi:phage gp45-like
VNVAQERRIQRALEALRQRVGQTFARCTLESLDSSSGPLRGTFRVLKGERLPAEVLQSYGFQSRPKGGSDGLVYFVGGDRSHAVVVELGDRRVLLELEDGEVAIADDLGQKVHLKRSGLVLEGGSRPVRIASSDRITLDAPLVECTADLQAAGDVSDESGTAQSLADMRATFNAHTHLAPGVTSGPSDLPVPPPNSPPM